MVAYAHLHQNNWQEGPAGHLPRVWAFHIAALPQYVLHLHLVTIGNEDGQPRAVHGQVHWIICQLPLQHTLLPAVVPDPAYPPHAHDSSCFLEHAFGSKIESNM